MRNLPVFFLSLLSIVTVNAQNHTRQSAWQQKADYEINVTLNPEAKTLSAFIRIHYFNNSPDTLKSIWLHVWPNAYSNTQTAFALQQLKNGKTGFQFSAQKDKGYIKGLHFTASNDSLQWHYDSIHMDIVEVRLNKPLLPQSNITIATPFEVKLPKLFSRGGVEGSFFAITQWYPKPAVYDVNGWNTMPYLDQGEFYSEFGDFKVDITAPKKYIIASTGNLISEKDTVIKDTFAIRTYTFIERNIHDFAWFASPDFFVEKRTIVLENGDSVQLNNFEHSKDLKSPNKNKGRDNLTAIETGIRAYSKKVGYYPYKNCTVVIGQLIAGGGMEYPTITVCRSSEPTTIIHEVGHNWFYGMLGNNERKHPWMDESINTFHEQKISKNLKGDSLFYKKFKGKNWISNYSTLMAYLFSAKQGLSQPLNLPSDEFSGMNYGAIVYGKGPILFAYLEQQLGDTLFEKCIKNYFNEWQYRHPLPDDMQSSFEKTSGKNLDWFFTDLLNENNSVDIVKTRNGYKVNGSIKLDSFLKQNQFKNNNLYGFLPERNYKNNGQKLKLITISFPFKLPRHNSRMDVNVTPIAGFNYYDKLFVGAAIYNRTMFRKKFEYVLMPAYAIGSEKVVGYGKLNYLSFSKNRHLFKTETGVQGQSFGLKIFSQLNQYFRINPYIRLHFKHKGKINEMMDKQLQLSFYHIGLQKNNYIAYQDSNKRNIYLNFPASYFFNYFKLSYGIEHRHPINALSLKINGEYGYNYKFSPQSARYVKAWINASYKYTYNRHNKQNKYFKTELFAGIFLDKKGDISRQQFYLSGNSGARDYLFNEALIGRSENAFSDNILGRQVISTNGNMRNILPFNPTNKWMLALANEICIPGIIPLKIYADLGYYPYLETTNTNSGPVTHLVKAELYATAGIILPLFKETIEIFVPVYQSKQFLKYNLVNYSFGNSIGFKLNLNKLHPFTQIDNFRP